MSHAREPMWRRYLRFYAVDAEADFDDEVAFHFDERIVELRGQGHDTVSARRIAEAEFGDLQAARRLVAAIDRRGGWRRRIRHHVAGAWGGVVIDVRSAVRGLRANGPLTAAAVLSLAAALAVNVIVLAATDSIVWRPFSVPAMDRLVRVTSIDESRGGTLQASWPDFQDWRAQSRTLELAAASGRSMNWRRGEEAELLRGTAVSAGYFRLHGVSPVLGREFNPGDEQSGLPVAMLGERVWRRYFASDRAVLGRPIELDGTVHTVVGVVAGRFDFFPWLPGKDVWVPLAPWTDRGRRSLLVVGSQRPGSDLTAAGAELTEIARRQADTYPESNRGVGARVEWAVEAAVSPSARTSFAAMNTAFGLVLLLASANVANLVMARTSSRGQELAVRNALGASKRRIVLLLTIESVLIAVSAAVLGIVLSTIGLAWLASVIGFNELGELASFPLSWRVIAMGLLLSMVAALLFGGLPALRTRVADLMSPLRAGSRTLASGPRVGRAHSILVAIELGLAVLLLTIAGTTIRSGYQLARLPLGFAVSDGLAFATYLPAGQYRDSLQAVAAAEAIARGISGLPGVDAVGYASGSPIGGSGGTTYEVVGREPADPRRPPFAQRHFVSMGYFASLGMPLLRGRSFVASDRLGSPGVTVVNEALARRHWPDTDAIGNRLEIGGVAHEIVGIVPSVRQDGVHNDPPPALYLPAPQAPVRYLRYFVRSQPGATGLAESVRAAVAEALPSQPIAGLVPLRAIADQGNREPRALAEVFLLLGVVSLVLAGAGVYGVTSCAVAGQSTEIGLRRALGASGGQVTMLVGKGAGRASLIGAGIGLLASIPASRAIGSALSLYDVPTFDGWSSCGAIVLVMTAGLAGLVVPARRALRISPMDALRRE